MTKKINVFGYLKADFASGLVVFLVALPLCLGIALASGAPPLSGIIAGIIGGIVVGGLSNSHLSVSGPAAGLTAIVLTAVSDLGGFEIFLAAVVVAGLIQLVLGLLKAGAISNYFPNNVIEGMLAGIGVIIILKQIPHALGYDNEFAGSERFVQSSGDNTISALWSALEFIHPGALLIALLSLGILILWERIPALKKLKVVPGALVAVVTGIALNELFRHLGSSLALTSSHLVSLPVPESLSDVPDFFVTPDFSALLRSDVWVVGVTIAVVASIETLLCIEAADRMDVHKRFTNTNRELRAQGIGNAISGLLGGLPMTSVVVRTSANASAGARTKMSTMIHGAMLLVSVVSIPMWLNKIPLATLAAVLLLVGYKLARPAVFKHFFAHGKYQFAPFIVTFIGVVFTDLLTGVALGIAVSIIAVLRGNMKRAYHFSKENYAHGDIIHIHLAQEVSFLNKSAIKNTLMKIPENAVVVIDATDTVYIAHDILEMIREFRRTRAVDENIEVKLCGFKKAYNLENTIETINNVTLQRKRNGYQTLNRSAKPYAAVAEH